MVVVFVLSGRLSFVEEGKGTEHQKRSNNRQANFNIKAKNEIISQIAINSLNQKCQIFFCHKKTIKLLSSYFFSFFCVCKIYNLAKRHEIIFMVDR